MSRGFGTTNGSGTTDKILSGYAGNMTTSLSFHTWVWRTGAGGGNFGRIIDQANGVQIAQDNAASTYYFIAPFSTTAGVWDITAPGTGAWVSFGFRYNGAATTNDPAFFLSGTAATITNEVTPVGTFGSGTGAWTIGGRASDNARHWNGKIAEPCLWQGVLLTDQNFTDLAAGIPPLSISPSSIPFYPPFWGDQVLDEGSAHNTLTVTGALATDDPAVRRPFFSLSGDNGANYPKRLVG